MQRIYITNAKRAILNPLSPLTAFLLCTGSTLIAAQYHEGLEIYQMLSHQKTTCSTLSCEIIWYETGVIWSKRGHFFLRLATSAKASSTWKILGSQFENPGVSVGLDAGTAIVACYTRNESIRTSIIFENSTKVKRWRLDAIVCFWLCR